MRIEMEGRKSRREAVIMLVTGLQFYDRAEVLRVVAVLKEFDQQ